MSNCKSASVWQPGCDTGEGGGEGEIIPIQLIGIADQLSYPLPDTVISDAATVHVNGRLLSPFDDYQIVLVSGVYTLTLVQAAEAGEEILVFSRATVPSAPSVPVSSDNNKALNFLADFATTDLTGINNVKTHNYDTLGDDGGTSWAATGNNEPVKAGTADLAKGLVYDINGLEFLMFPYETKPECFGVKSSNTQAGTIIDVTAPLKTMLAFLRLRAPQDGVTFVDKGGTDVKFRPRAEYYISETIDNINLYTGLDWNNALIWKTTPGRVFNIEANFATFKNFRIDYADNVSYEDLYNTGELAVELSFGQIEEVNSETVFSKFGNIVVHKCYRGVGINSVSPTNAGLLWQTIFERVDVLNALDYSYYFNCIEQTSTTVKFQTMHADCNGRSSITIGAFSYFAKQHMPSNLNIQPEVTVGWADYWDKQPVSGDRPGYQPNTFYRTFGKHHYINNITTVEASVCSMDGGHNIEDGSVFNTISGALKIGVFHLESHVLYKPDGLSCTIGSDCVIDIMWIGALKRRLPTALDKAYIIGGVAARNRSLTVHDVLNNNPSTTDTTGILKYINGGKDIVAFNNIGCGAGVSRHLTENMPDATWWAKKYDGDEGQTSSPTLGIVTVTGGATVAVTPTREQEGTEFITDAPVTMDVTLDIAQIPIGSEFWFFNEVGTVTAKDISGDILGPVASPTEGLIMLGTNPSTAGKVVNIKRLTDVKFRMMEGA